MVGMAARVAKDFPVDAMATAGSAPVQDVVSFIDDLVRGRMKTYWSPFCRMKVCNF